MPSLYAGYLLAIYNGGSSDKGIDAFAHSFLYSLPDSFVTAIFEACGRSFDHQDGKWSRSRDLVPSGVILSWYLYAQLWHVVKAEPSKGRKPAGSGHLI